jgi:hypothetical protein
VTNFWNLTLPGAYDLHNFECVNRNSMAITTLSPNEIDVATFMFEEDTVNGTAVGGMRSKFVTDPENVRLNFGMGWATSFASSHKVNAKIVRSDGSTFRHEPAGLFSV